MVCHLYSYFIQYSILYSIHSLLYLVEWCTTSYFRNNKSKTTDTLLARWLSETHRETLSAQRAAATKKLRAEVKLVTCAQLFEAGS